MSSIFKAGSLKSAIYCDCFYVELRFSFLPEPEVLVLFCDLVGVFLVSSLVEAILAWLFCGVTGEAPTTSWSVRLGRLEEWPGVCYGVDRRLLTCGCAACEDAKEELALSSRTTSSSFRVICACAKWNSVSRSLYMRMIFCSRIGKIYRLAFFDRLLDEVY